MPMYEYVCDACKKPQELFRRVDDHPVTCPACGAKDSLRLQISRSSFRLKGTGWYATDYSSINK